MNISSYLLTANNKYSQIEVMGQVRQKLLCEARKASSSGKYPEAAEGIMERVNKLEKAMQRKSSSIQTDLNKAVKETREALKEEKEKFREVIEKKCKNCAQCDSCDLRVEEREVCTKIEEINPEISSNSGKSTDSTQKPKKVVMSSSAKPKFKKPTNDHVLDVLV